MQPLVRIGGLILPLPHQLAEAAHILLSMIVCNKE